MRSIATLVLVASILYGAGACAAAEPPGGGTPPPAEETATMAGTARQLVASLDDAGRSRMLLPFEPEGRREWSYLPGSRPGLALGAMDAGQRRLVHRLLRSALSTPGYLKVHGVMELEAVLREVEAIGPVRDPGAYHLVLFGEPGETEPWAWRFEGHHVSVHFTQVPGEGTSPTPLFLGANPAEVGEGRRAGLRVLAGEEDLARELVRSLDDEQRSRAVLAAEAPDDILTRMDPAARRLTPPGLPAAEMTAAQRALLWRLIEEYVGNAAPELADAELERLRSLDLDALTFAWAGGTEPGEGHYYRIQGKTLLIEYDNTQDGANHAHTVWRDLEGDFGEDLLREHYRTSPHHRDPAEEDAAGDGGQEGREG